jgi:hypothetical protein
MMDINTISLVQGAELNSTSPNQGLSFLSLSLSLSLQIKSLLQINNR